MAILGLSAGYHDAAAAVVGEHGKILFAAHAERYSKVKNDPLLNDQLITDALIATSAAGEEITEIAWYENRWARYRRQIMNSEIGLLDIPKGAKQHIQSLECGWMLNHIPIRTYHHHQSHIAGCAATSPFPFRRAIGVVIDALGETDCFSFWLVENYDKGITYKKLHSIKYPNSLGLFYSAMTEQAGLKPNEEEYILMGMAAYAPDFEIDDEWIVVPSDDEDVVARLNYRPRFNFRSNENLHIGMPYAWPQNATNDFEIAKAAQKMVEVTLRAVHRQLETYTRIYNTNKIFYSGGVALNCAANHILTKETEWFVWTMPNPGDAGSALGAAALSYKYPLKWEGPYLGHDIPGEYPIGDILKVLDTTGVCGVASGRAEYGPRAFGNRSLLADPRGPDAKDRVNEIKHRQKFRPFSPAILAENFHTYFDVPEWTRIDYRYMQYVCKLKPQYRDQFPAVQHVDDTCRVQVVDKQYRCGIRDLLMSMEFWMPGCPMLLNTSLNIKGEPMVNDRSDADRFEKLYGVKVFS